MLQFRQSSVYVLIVRFQDMSWTIFYCRLSSNYAKLRCSIFRSRYFHANADCTEDLLFIDFFLSSVCSCGKYTHYLFWICNISVFVFLCFICQSRPSRVRDIKYPAALLIVATPCADWPPEEFFSSEHRPPQTNFWLFGFRGGCRRQTAIAACNGIKPTGGIIQRLVRHVSSSLVQLAVLTLHAYRRGVHNERDRKKLWWRKCGCWRIGEGFACVSIFFVIISWLNKRYTVCWSLAWIFPRWCVFPAKFAFFFYTCLKIGFYRRWVFVLEISL